MIDKIKDNMKLISGIVVLIILVLIVGMVLSSNNKPGHPKDSVVLIDKKDKTKDWVYTASYKRDVKVASIMIDGQELKATDIKAPYINIDSIPADYTNDDIKYKFNDAILKYNHGISKYSEYLKEFDYSYYVNGTILSVVINSQTIYDDVTYPFYYTYNYDLVTGQPLSFEEIYTYLGFTSDSLEERVSEKISEVMDKKMASIRNDSPELRKNNSLVTYKYSIKTNTIKYFLSENNTLNVVVGLDIPIGRGTFENILVIK